jgi:hypothetical protein
MTLSAGPTRMELNCSDIGEEGAVVYDDNRCPVRESTVSIWNASTRRSDDSENRTIVVDVRSSS